MELPFSLVILFSVAVITPLLARPLRLPVLVLEICIGVMLGESWLNVIPSNEVLDFFRQFGLIYIMFLAGFEIDFAEIRKYFSPTVVIACCSLFVPFFAGVALGRLIAVSPLLMGTVFSTTSLGLILPLSKELVYDRRFVSILLGSVILVDAFSIFILAFYMSAATDALSVSFIYSFLLLLVMFATPVFLRKTGLAQRLVQWASVQSQFSIMTRISFALIAIIAAISGYLGFHAIIGAFLAGLIMSELLDKTPMVKKQLEGFGYGFFIPLFFLLIGAKIDLLAVFSSAANIKILVLVVIVGLLSKIIGASIAAKVMRFNMRESLSLGLFHTARLSLIIAVAEIGRELGLISEALFASLMLLAVISAVVGPVLGKYLLK